MKQICRIAAAAGAALLLAGCATEADRLVGRWEGTLDVGSAAPQLVKPGQATLKLTTAFRKAEGGTLAGTLDSPMQAVSGIPLDSVTVKDGKVTFSINRLFASYDGRLEKDGTLAGQWKQGPLTLPLTFRKQP